MLWLALGLWGCQEPFGTDRHDLVGDRIVAIAIDPARVPTGDTLTPRVALLADGNPWSDDAVALSWHWLQDPSDLADLSPGDTPDAVGPAPSLIAPAEGPLGLLATFPSGATRRAFLDFERGEVRSPPALEGVTFEPATPIASGDERTLTARVDGEPPMMRWMTVGGRGAFLEQERLVASWQANDIEVDDGEIVASEPIADGPVTLVALAIDQAGGNDLLALEFFVGDAPQGLFTTGGRFLPTDAPTTTGPWHGTLAADDASPTGLSLVGVTAGLLPDPDPYGTTSLACTVPVSGAFDPTWLFEGRCLRSQVVGAVVAVEAQ